jgi:hypothetical protein
MLHWDAEFPHIQCFNSFVEDFLKSFLLMEARRFWASFWDYGRPSHLERPNFFGA